MEATTWECAGCGVELNENSDQFKCTGCDGVETACPACAQFWAGEDVKKLNRLFALRTAARLNRRAA